MKQTPCLLLGILFASFACLSQARGQESATDKARDSFFAGIELFKEGSYEAALAELQKAYQLAPNYRVLYNIGQVQFELHDYVSAYATLKDYLEQGGDEIPEARRSQVDTSLQKLEQRIAYLEVDCNLSDADIRVDDISVGKSPLTAPVPVNAGTHRIAAVKPGFAVAARMVSLTGEERVSVKLKIAAPPPEAQPTRPVPRPSASTRTAPEQSLGRHHRGLVASLTVATSCALATGIFGWRLLVAKSDFDHEVSKVPYDRGTAEGIRSRAMAYQYLTIGFGAATLLSSGLALYLALDGGSGNPRGVGSMALSPAINGVIVRGRW